MTTGAVGAPETQPEAPPPPFDRELAPVVEMLVSLRAPNAYRSDNITEMGRPVPGVEAPGDAALSRGGAYTVEERSIPGADGAPPLSLLICLPTGASTPTAAIGHDHQADVFSLQSLQVPWHAGEWL